MAIVNEVLTSNATGRGVLGTAQSMLVVGTANVSDLLTYFSGASLTADATAIEQILTTQLTTMESRAAFEDLIHEYVVVLMAATATADNEFELSVSLELAVTATASATLYPIASYNQLEISAAIVRDLITPTRSIEVVGAATAADLLTITAGGIEILVAAANATDELVPWRGTFELLTGGAIGSTEVTFNGSVYNDTIVAGAQARNIMWARDFGSIAWVMNTQTGGLTSYDNFGFSSIAFHDGVLYGTSPDGLFALNADNDDGRNIDSLYKGGFLDFGSEFKKRIADICVGHTGGALECDIETASKQVYTYEMGACVDDLPHNSRIKPGRGLSSRRWRFGFRNIDGADFQIQDVTVRLGTSKRRL